MSQSDASNVALVLNMVIPPPKQTVYQRILKPFPKVSLTMAQKDAEAEAIMATFGGGAALIVEASLHRIDNGELVNFLLGVTTESAQINGDVRFSRLKIGATSQQIGVGLFLRFTLKKLINGQTEPVDSCKPIDSAPIEVFSHTIYLQKSANASPSTQNDDIESESTKIEPVTAPLPPTAVENQQKDQDDVADLIICPISEIYHDSDVQILLGMGPEAFDALERHGGVKTIGQLADLMRRNPTGFERIKLHGNPPDIHHLVKTANGLLARAHEQRSKDI